MSSQEIKREFDQQISTLLKKEYPKHARLSESAFLKHIEPLKEKLTGIIVPDVDFVKGRLPFVIVVKSELVPTDQAMNAVEREGQGGFVNMTPSQPSDFKTIKTVTIPDGRAYLLVDIDRGKESLNVRPQDALQSIIAQNRSPITIDEGIAIITHYPDFLMKNNCFSMLASRMGDQKVPALWLTDKKIRLGWCWDGNPHTWLGSASAQRRVAA